MVFLFEVRLLWCFVYCGVDFVCFFVIKLMRKVIVKCYFCLFICVSIWVVYLEIVYLLDIVSFFNVFFRMVVRCGKLEVMISDNGMNFMLIERELCDLVLILD